MLRSLKHNGNNLKNADRNRCNSAKPNAKTKGQDDLQPIRIGTATQEILDVKTLKKPLPKSQSKEIELAAHHDSLPEDRMAISLQKFSNDPENKVLSCLYGLAAQKKHRPVNLDNHDYYSPTPALRNALIETDNADIMIRLDRTIKRPAATEPEPRVQATMRLNNYIDGLDDGNSVIRAYIKNNYEELPKVDRVDQIEAPAAKKKQQLAEDRLRSMFNKKEKAKAQFVVPLASAPVVQKAPSRPTISDLNISASVAQEIAEQEYLKDSFEKESQIKESIIKESMLKESAIREPIEARSAIRQSIRQSIPKQSRLSSRSAIKQEISKSRHSIAESINDSSDRPKRRQQDEEAIDESIEQVYEQDFEAASGSASAVKPQATPAKQQQSDPSEESISKSFRKKKSLHTPHLGSIKLAEEINNRQSQKEFEDFLKSKEGGFTKHGLAKEFGHMKDIVVEQQDLEKIKKEVNELMGRTKATQDNWKKDEQVERDRYSKDRVNNLYYKFQSELTRLVNDQDLNFKIQRLTSFLPGNLPAQQGQGQDGLTNIILSRILQAITHLRETALDYNNLRQMQQEHDKKVQELLKNQQRLLRWEMEKKLDQRDEQIRKLIQGLASAKNAGSSGRDRIMDVLKKNRNVSFVDSRDPRRRTEEEIAEYSAQFEDEFSGSRKDAPSFSQSVDKDYSMEFEAVSWDSSIDLWRNLSQKDKARLYDKQTAQVTDFLTRMMLEQLKGEALQRSLDVSFEFPQAEHQRSSLAAEHLPSLAKRQEQASDDLKPAFDRHSLLEELSESDSGDSEAHYVKPTYPEAKVPPPKVAPAHSLPEASDEQQKKTLEKNPKVAEKARKVVTKYQKRLVSKKDAIVRKLIKLLRENTSAPVAQKLHGFTILEEKDVEKEDQCLLRAFEETVVIGLVGFYNSHPLPHQKLAAEMLKRYERIVSVAGESLIKGVGLVIPLDTEDPKESRLPLKDRLYKLQSKPLLLQSSLSESAAEFDDQRRQKEVRSSIEEHIISELIMDAAREMKRRR